MSTDNNLFSIFRVQGQTPGYMVGLGHGAIHWVGMVVYVLLPYIRQDLGLSFVEAGTLVAIFHISSTVANIGSGLTVDMTGRRVLFQVVSVAVGGVSLIIFGLTANYLILAAMIALIGIANNFWHPAAIAFLSAQYPNNRGYVLSIHALGANVGDALAPLAVGALLGWISWQQVAIVNALPVFVVSFLLLLIVLPKDSLARDKTKRTLSFREYVSGLGGMVKDKAVMGLSLMAAFRTAAQVGLFTFLPLYFVDVLKASPVVMGTGMMAMQVAGVIAAPIAGAASDRIGQRPIVIMGTTGTTIIIAALTFIDNELMYISCIAVLGLCLYAIRPVVHSWLMHMVPDHLGGSATSLMFGIQSALAASMPVIGGVIADTYGLTSVFYFIAATMLISNLIVLILPKTAPVRAAPAA
jgi:MFS family permease